jgi:hypothetical protein
MGEGKQQAAGRGQKPEMGSQDPNADFLPITCRAGAVVLLVGSWFDGGLFKLATASTFWILLELGRADLVPPKVTEETKADSNLGGWQHLWSLG